MKAHELLSDETRWTRRTMARQADGHECQTTDPLAQAWCLTGAVFRCYLTSAERAAAFNRLAHALAVPIDHIARWNDWHGRTIAEVQQVLHDLDL